MLADTRSLMIAYIKELNIRNLYREGKKYKEPIQMYCYSRYKCSRYSDAFPKLAPCLSVFIRAGLFGRIFYYVNAHRWISAGSEQGLRAQSSVLLVVVSHSLQLLERFGFFRCTVH